MELGKFCVDYFGHGKIELAYVFIKCEIAKVHKIIYYVYEKYVKQSNINPCNKEYKIILCRIYIRKLYISVFFLREVKS